MIKKEKKVLSEYRAEFAATIFIRECLRQWRKMHPGQEPPMAALVEYPIAQQRAIIKAVTRAIEASDGMDEIYRIFIEDKIKGKRESQV